MSYDLFIFSQRQPTEQQVRGFLASYPAASTSGTLAGRGTMVVEDQLPEEQGWAFTIDPPDPFESTGFEDVLERLDAVPGWVTFIAIAYHNVGAALDIALPLAQALSRENEGVVYDPQTDGIT